MNPALYQLSYAAVLIEEQFILGHAFGKGRGGLAAPLHTGPERLANRL